VDNAIKFTQQGTVTIMVTTLDSGDENNLNPTAKFRIEIKDTGIGMSEETTKILFTAFSQADISYTRRYGGTGLGLAISKGLVKKMNGKIWCKSELGKGTSLIFTGRFALQTGLTQKSDKSHPLSETKAVAAKAPELPEWIKGAKILLVEDNEVNQMVAQKMLEKYGFTVKVADNGLKALASLEAETFDLVLMDIQMPELDGLEATRRLRADPRFINLPVLALTAHAMEGDREISLAAGMNEHLTKPFKINDFIKVLSQWPVPESRI
jgi:CheY-like chemotaxis protein